MEITTCTAGALWSHCAPIYITSLFTSCSTDAGVEGTTDFGMAARAAAESPPYLIQHSRYLTVDFVAQSNKAPLCLRLRGTGARGQGFSEEYIPPQKLCRYQLALVTSSTHRCQFRIVLFTLSRCLPSQLSQYAPKKHACVMQIPVLMLH